MRLVVFLVLVFVLALWAWGCFTAGRYIPLGYAEAGIISSAIAGKAVQARFEYGLPGNTPTICAPTIYADDGSGAGDSAPAPLSNRQEQPGGRHD